MLVREWPKDPGLCCTNKYHFLGVMQALGMAGTEAPEGRLDLDDLGGSGQLRPSAVSEAEGAAAQGGALRILTLVWWKATGRFSVVGMMRSDFVKTRGPAVTMR